MRIRQLVVVVLGVALALTTAAPASGQDGLRRGQAFMGWNDAAGVGPGTAGPTRPGAQASVDGMDVSRWQGNVDWAYWWNQGKRFTYVKATESTGYENPYFYQQYVGSYDQGFIRGAYHFATPDTSSGAAQANFFVDNGGGWSPDGMTLPGVLDIEYNPYGDTCFDMSRSQLVAWIDDFADTYRSRTGRDVVIYTARNFWVPCTGDSRAFSQTNPLWVADWNNSTPVLFSGWSYHTFHQWTDSPLDQNRFNGSYDRLQALALG